jgi:hypothetical protein
MSASTARCISSALLVTSDGCTGTAIDWPSGVLISHS